jgi:hypothetical protein
MKCSNYLKLLSHSSIGQKPYLKPDKMSRTRSTTTDGFTEVPLRLTEAEKQMVRAFRAASSSEDAPRVTTASRGGRGGGRGGSRVGPPYVARGAGAASGGAGVPKKPTWASITSKGVKEETTSTPRETVDDEKIAEKINLKKLESISTLTELNSSGLFEVNNIRNDSGTFKGLLVKIHSDVFKLVEKSEYSGMIYTAMNAFKNWLTANNETVLTDIKSNWNESFLESALEGADVVYSKRNAFAKGTSVLVGKKSNTPKAFVDDA